MEKQQYSDSELAEFKELIDTKLEKARKELKILQDSLVNPNEDGAVEAASGQKLMEEAADVSEREQNSQLAARQQKFITNLESEIPRCMGSDRRRSCALPKPGGTYAPPVANRQVRT